MTYDIDTVELPERPAAVVRARLAHDGIGKFLGPAFGEVMMASGRQHVTPTGAPFARYRPTEDGGWDVEAGFPVSGAVQSDGRVGATTLPAGAAAHTVHIGDYGRLGEAYAAVDAWIAEHHLVRAGEPWECYLDAPEVAEPRTELFFPCRSA